MFQGIIGRYSFFFFAYLAGGAAYTRVLLI